MLKLELGKYYKDRYGKVWGPLTRTPPEQPFARTHPFHAGGRTFREDGTYEVWEGGKALEDLVKEWQPEPAPKPAPQTPWYPDDSGDWIEHDGKGCPVPPDTEVHVLLEAERKRRISSWSSCVNSAKAWDTSWFGSESNSIVAYKLVVPKATPKPQVTPKPAPVAVSSGRIARYFVISREGVVYCYTSLRAAQKAARGFAIAVPGRPYTIAVFVETISSKER